MAFWTHFVIQSPGTVMVLLWGMPFLVSAEGLERSAAASLMSMFVVVGIAFGAIYGWICANHPRWRIPLVFALYLCTNGYWFYILAINGPASYAQLFGLFCVLGISGPGSMLAFDFSRVSVPRSRLGSANGFINIGGFLASFTMMFLIGVVLDWHHGLDRASPLYSLDGFRLALAVQFVVLGLGIAMFAVEARQAKNAEKSARE
jgi:sugar phosphate permease